MFWGGVGETFVDEPATAAEAIEAAGLNWEVELRQAGVKNSASTGFVNAPNKWGVVRADNEECFGIVGARYEVFQNHEVFSFCDDIVDDGGAKYESAWSVRGGRVVGLTMRLPETVNILGFDEHQPYIVGRTTHDGSGSIQLGVVVKRMECTNMVSMLLRNSKNVWKLRHTQTSRRNLTAARTALDISFDYMDVFQEEMERFALIPMSEKKISGIVDSALIGRRVGERARKRDIEIIVKLQTASKQIPDELRMTGYGAYQAVTEYYDHIRTYRTPESRFMNITEGLAAKVRQNVYEAIAA